LVLTLFTKRPAKFVVLLVLFLCGCSALQISDTGGPSPDSHSYPIAFTEDPRDAVRSAIIWRRQTRSPRNADRSEIKLQPLTATIASLPPNAEVYLPKVGANEKMSEEEMRESLRRFIQDWQRLIGAQPEQLSLIDRTDEPDGTKLARYEQQPFRYPLRGNYGKLRIRFAPDRRVLEFNSTCIPNSDRLQSAFASIDPQLNWEDAAKRVENLSITFNSTSGHYQLTNANKPEVRELVVYAKDPVEGATSIELYLTWEVAVSNAPFHFVYLDSVKGEVIATA
jgi:hypothetical protein